MVTEFEELLLTLCETELKELLLMLADTETEFEELLRLCDPELETDTELEELLLTLWDCELEFELEELLLTLCDTEMLLLEDEELLGGGISMLRNCASAFCVPRVTPMHRGPARNSFDPPCVLARGSAVKPVVAVASHTRYVPGE
jgi:hypothetical protein